MRVKISIAFAWAALLQMLFAPIALAGVDDLDDALSPAAMRAIVAWCDAVVAHDVDALAKFAPPKLALDSVPSWRRYTEGVVKSIEPHGPCTWRLRFIKYNMDTIKFEAIYVTKSDPHLAGKMWHTLRRDGDNWFMGSDFVVSD